VFCRCKWPTIAIRLFWARQKKRLLAYKERLTTACANQNGCSWDSVAYAAGQTACSGTSTCEGALQNKCGTTTTSTGICLWNTHGCAGNPSCSLGSAVSSCGTTTGCIWNAGTCEGQISCAAATDGTKCASTGGCAWKVAGSCTNNAGCAWGAAGAYCSGTATEACSTKGQQDTCEEQVGCAWGTAGANCHGSASATCFRWSLAHWFVVILLVSLLNSVFPV
jgi:hypothetical protein